MMMLMVTRSIHICIFLVWLGYADDLLPEHVPSDLKIHKEWVREDGIHIPKRYLEHQLKAAGSNITLRTLYDQVSMIDVRVEQTVERIESEMYGDVLDSVRQYVVTLVLITALFGGVNFLVVIVIWLKTQRMNGKLKVLCSEFNRKDV